MVKQRRSRLVIAGAALTALSFVAASCGDDDKSGSTTPAGAASSTTAAAGGSTATSTAGSTAASTAGSTAASTAGSTAGGDAAAMLKELTTRPTKITQTEKITGEVPKGKRIIWIQCSVPACIALGKPFEEATKALGWSLKTITHNGTPEGVKNAWAEAVREAPDGVVSSGYPRQMFETELAELKAKNIPVIQLTTTDTPGDGNTAIINGPKRNVDIGEQQAIFVAADSGGKANVLWVTSTFPILKPQFEGINGKGGFKPSLAELCPGCKIETLEIPLDALATGAPQRIVSTLQAKPEINYVVGAFADVITPMPGALADAGLKGKVKLMTYSQNESLSAAVKDGSIAAVVGFAGPEDMWQAADTLLRIFLKLPFQAEFDQLPNWIITQKDVPSTTEYYPLVADYQAQYKALWGVS